MTWPGRGSGLARPGWPDQPGLTNWYPIFARDLQGARSSARFAREVHKARNLREAQISLVCAREARAEGDAQADVRACAQPARASSNARTPLPAALSEQLRARQRAQSARAREARETRDTAGSRVSQVAREAREFCEFVESAKICAADFCCARRR